MSDCFVTMKQFIQLMIIIFKHFVGISQLNRCIVQPWEIRFREIKSFNILGSFTCFAEIFTLHWEKERRRPVKVNYWVGWYCLINISNLFLVINHFILLCRCWCIHWVWLSTGQLIFTYLKIRWEPWYETAVFASVSSCSHTSTILMIFLILFLLSQSSWVTISTASSSACVRTWPIAGWISTPSWKPANLSTKPPSCRRPPKSSDSWWRRFSMNQWV